MSPAPHDPTSPFGHLFPLIYQRLRALVIAALAKEHRGHALQPTEIVHKLYLRVAEERLAGDVSPNRFMAYAAGVLHNLLVDMAREAQTLKRGGGCEVRTISTAAALVPAEGPQRVDLLDLDEALKKLNTLSHRQHQIVEMRFFAGLSYADIGDILGVSVRTVENDWSAAKAYLRTQLTAPTD